MNQIWHLMIHEIKLFLRNKTFWLAGLLIIVSIFIPPLAFLFIQFAVITIITRDETSGFSEILVALPYSITNLYISRTLAVFCLLLGLWPFILLTVGFLPGVTPAEWLLNGMQLVFLTLKYINICMMAIGIVFLTGLITRRPWQLYLITSVYWLLGNNLSIDLPVFTSLSTFFDFGHNTMRLIAPSALGYLLQQDFILWFAIFQTTGVITLLALVVLLHKFQRKEPVLGTKMLPSLFLVMTLVFFFTGFIAWQELNHREREFGLIARQIKKSHLLAGKLRGAIPLIKTYKLTIKLQTKAHYLEGRATVQFHPTERGQIVFFTLRNYFRVSSVTEVNQGSSLRWWRSGPLLAVRIPTHYRQGRPMILMISYSGYVQEWLPRSVAEPSGPVNFVSPSFSLLRSGYAWYPVPGVHQLYTVKDCKSSYFHSQKTILWAEPAIHPPVPFDLTVELDSDKTVVSNLDRLRIDRLTGKYQSRYYFRSLQGRDVFLVVGPYHYEKRTFQGRKDFIDVYTYHQHQKKITDLLNSLSMPYSFFEELIQYNYPKTSSFHRFGKAGTVVEIPPFSNLCGEEKVSNWLTLTDTVLITEDLFPTKAWRLASIDTMQSNKRDRAVLQRWWHEELSSNTGGWFREGDLTEGLTLYLYTLYMENTRSRSFYGQVKENLLSGKAIDGDFFLPSFQKGPVVRDVFMTLDMIRTSRLGMNGIKKITNMLYRVYVSEGQISPTEFSAVVKSVAADGDWQPTKFDELCQRLKSVAKQVDNLKMKPLHLSFTPNYTFRPEDWLP